MEVRKKDVTFAQSLIKNIITMAGKRFKVTIEMPDKKKVVFTKRFLDEFKIEEMVGKNPTRDVVDNYLLYIPELFDYPGADISRGVITEIVEQLYFRRI